MDNHDINPKAETVVLLLVIPITVICIFVICRVFMQINEEELFIGEEYDV